MKRSAIVFGALSLSLLIPQSPATAQSSAFADPAPLYPPAFARAAPQPEVADEPGDSVGMASHLRRQIVSYSTREAPGTIVIDTPNTYLYYVLGNGRAVRYGIGVGRDGFRWSGTQRVARKAEWPDWHPPAEMVARQPYLPRFMAGGPSNPLGARALYLGNSIYRIHGTNSPSTIGGRVSSGCIRMLNEDVVDLYGRVKVGTKVVVLPDGGRRSPDIARRRAPDRSNAISFYEEQSRARDRMSAVTETASRIY
ncbi:MAG: L,D-transpeptidase [Pseudorhodoplanes sp.]|uniref:L,D-transpeptidase n=1 Tax=Pseudorhodoplanes sp. TaxID=1934341 RepID=UPI003D11921C